MSDTKRGREQWEALERKIDDRDRQIKEVVQHNKMLGDNLVRAYAQLNSMFTIPALSGFRSMATAAMDVAHAPVTQSIVSKYHEDMDRMEKMLRIIYHCVDLEKIEALNHEYVLDLDASLVEAVKNHPMMEILEDIEIMRLVDNGLPYKTVQDRVKDYMEQLPKE